MGYNDSMVRTISSPHSVFQVSLHQEKTGGYWVESKELPYVYSQGETIDEALRNFSDAILTHFQIPSRQLKPSLRLKINSSQLVLK